MAMAKDKKLTKNWSIPVEVSFDTERQLFNSKIFDNINTGTKTKNDFQFLSMELFKDLNLPMPSTNDFEIVMELPNGTLAEQEKTLNTLIEIRIRIEQYNWTLGNKRIADYQLYEKKSANLVTLQLMDAADEESIHKTQAEIRELVQEGKNSNAETVALMELLRVVNEKIEKTKLSIEQSHRDIFASRLKQARQKAGLTQTDLANLTFTTQGAITSYEIARREPSLTTLSRLSEKLNVSTDWLLGLN